MNSWYSRPQPYWADSTRISLIGPYGLSRPHRNLTLTEKAIRALVLHDELQAYWQGKDVFALVQHLEGDVARKVDGRETRRFLLGNTAYYRKLHTGVGWLEILKNLIRFRLPVIGARNEWQALNRMPAIGIASLEPVGFGEKYTNPARRLSFLITRELQGTLQLDHYLAARAEPLRFDQKLRLIQKIAEISRRLHSNGINHRDFYLCHFMLEMASVDAWLKGSEPLLYLVDLHRAQVRRSVPERWLVKDIASLLFSANGFSLTQRDCYRFLRHYFNAPLSQIMLQHSSLLKKISQRSAQLERREQRLIARGLRG